jgi:hypothetical protein
LVVEITDPRERTLKWLGTFVGAYDEVAFALFGSRAQLNLHRPSAHPPVSSHQTDLTPLLPRPAALNLRPDPHVQLHHRSLLLRYSPCVTPKFNVVREGSVLAPTTPGNIIRMLNQHIGYQNLQPTSCLPKNFTARRLCMWQQ